MNTLVLSKHLLWKDYRQLRPALIGCWAIMAAILLLNCVRQLLAINRETIFPDAIMLVLAAPTLAAMAASGILIGHERQTRTWNWSSSLPISWTSSLISKFIVWLIGSVLMVGTLYLLFLLLLQVCRMQGMQRALTPEWISPLIVVTTVLVVPLIVYVCFSLAALLWNDTLSAFVGAAIVVSVIFVMTSDLLPRMIIGAWSVGQTDARVQTIGVLLELIVLVLIAGIFMVRAYHWRWTTGQLASIGWAQRVAAPLSSFQRRLLWQNAAWNGSAPGEFRMLLTHSLSMSLWIRLMIFAGTIAMALAITGGSLGITICGAAIMGVTVFSGDQSQAAYKFLSDRGVSWWRLLLAHALPAFVLAITPVVASVVWEMQRTLQPIAGLAVIYTSITAFILGLFCSLCTRLPLLSVCLTVGALIATFLAWASVFNFYYGTLQSGMPPNAIALLFLAETGVLVAATIILLRRWLVFDRVQGAYYFLATLFIGLVPTHLLAVAFCFLTVPNVPWQGLSADQIKLHSTQPRATIEASLPLYMQNRLYTYDPSHINSAIEFTVEQMRADANLYPADELPPDLVDGQVTLETISSALKDMESALDRLPPEVTMNPTDYGLAGEVENTAWLGLYATQELKDLELARRAWKVNRQLLGLFDYTTMEGNQAVQCRLVSALLRTHLTGQDWEFLRSGGSLAELQPAPVSRETWSLLLRMRATAARATHRNDPFWQISFPVRWYHERQLAWILQQELQAVAGQSITSAPIGYSAFWQDSRSIPFIVSLEAALPR